MTLRRLDTAVAYQKLRLMEKILDDLDRLGEITADRLLDEPIINYAVERMLTQLVELASGINTHISAAHGKVGNDYRQSFDMAADIGLISQDLAMLLKPSAGMRNVLVHEYLTIDPAKVAKAAELARKQYRRYLSEAAQYLVKAQKR
ncbi:MAG TPA: DUF86 domain-containing protein [Mycobacteriales bacterium]|jgi:uncharacterized protein YutE (UPF0331/DUF86 family)|nr:DUF86 domain-containing protein [Mycobacteriales bacterium]